MCSSHPQMRTVAVSDANSGYLRCERRRSEDARLFGQNSFVTLRVHCKVDSCNCHSEVLRRIFVAFLEYGDKDPSLRSDLS
jgi:hypothetical protein